MDGSLVRRFFLEPQQTFQRQYEALRAIFVDYEPLDRVAVRFGYKPSTLKAMASRLRADCRRGVAPPLFLPGGRGRPLGAGARLESAAPETPDVADCRELNLEPGRTIRSRVAGVLLFLPLLTRLGFDRLVTEAGYPSSGMIPDTAALLSLLLLALKLLDKERRSHIDDFNYDEVIGLFAGLNVPPRSRSPPPTLTGPFAISNAACCRAGSRHWPRSSFPSPKDSRSTSTRSLSAATLRRSTAITERCIEN